MHSHFTHTHNEHDTHLEYHDFAYSFITDKPVTISDFKIMVAFHSVDYNVSSEYMPKYKHTKHEQQSRDVRNGFFKFGSEKNRGFGSVLKNRQFGSVFFVDQL